MVIARCANTWVAPIETKSNNVVADIASMFIAFFLFGCIDLQEN
jgi:hypothetical protein